jgi:hypothetical protein
VRPGAIANLSYERGRRDALLELADEVADRCALAYLDEHADAAAGVAEADDDLGMRARLIRLEVATALRARACAEH